MIDFSKLGTTTQAEREAEDQAWVERQKDIMRARKQMLVEIAEAPGALDAWSANFVRDMQRLAMKNDPITGLLGGELTVLSDKQMAQLTRIHAMATK